MLEKGEAHFAHQENNLNSSLLNIPRFQVEQGESGGRGKLMN